jgi:hypothetical protein
MTTSTTPQLPSAGIVQVRLLQDAVYTEDSDLWTVLLRMRTRIDAYFREIGLQLVVNEEDGFAYLVQMHSEDGLAVPQLFRRDRLTKGVAIIGVILRELLLNFDETIHDESKLVVDKGDIVTLVTPYYPATNDEIARNKKIDSDIARSEKLGLIRSVISRDGEVRFEIRRIVKARFPLALLKELKEKLQGHVDTKDDDR